MSQRTVKISAFGLLNPFAHEWAVKGDQHVQLDWGDRRRGGESNQRMRWLASPLVGTGDQDGKGTRNSKRHKLWGKGQVWSTGQVWKLVRKAWRERKWMGVGVSEEGEGCEGRV
jgi:hypothetical protein